MPGRTACFGGVLYVFSVWCGFRRSPSGCLEPNALAGYLLRCSEMRSLFCCRPSGSPSEAMGNTGSGNPHRPPDGDNLSQSARRSGSAAKDRQTSSCCGCVSERLSRRRKACPAQIRRMQPAPCVCGFIQSRMAAASSVCFAAEKSLPRQAAARGKDAARFLPAVLHRSARRPSRKQGSDGSGVSAAACSMRLMEAGGLILRAAASDAFVVPPHFQSCIMSGRACPALGFAVRRPMFRSKAAVHKASSMRIRKPANALAGKRPKHRRAKLRQRWPRPARDGRRG